MIVFQESTAANQDSMTANPHKLSLSFDLHLKPGIKQSSQTRLSDSIIGSCIQAIWRGSEK